MSEGRYPETVQVRIEGRAEIQGVEFRDEEVSGETVRHVEHGATIVPEEGATVEIGPRVSER